MSWFDSVLSRLLKSAVVFAVAVLLVVPDGVDAFQLSGNRWPEASATFNVDIPGAGGIWNSAFETAQANWSSVTPFRYLTCRACPADPCIQDSINGVGFTPDDCGVPFGSTTLAVTTSWRDVSTSTILETDIVFNSNESWNVYSGPWQSGSWFGVGDFRRVAVHELGHALGLGHEDVTPSVMASFAGNIEDPTADDVTGVAAIYAPAQCSGPVAIQSAGSVSGQLAFGDCTIAGLGLDSADMSLADQYQVILPVAGVLTIDLESNDFDAFLYLYDATLTNFIAFDDDSGSGLNSRISMPLGAGTYTIVVNSAIAGTVETGAYQLSTCYPCTSTQINTDLVIDFGTIGLWARMNDSSWQKLNNSSPDQVVVGDVDGNGMDDVIADFSSTFGGIFIKRNQGAWNKLHNFTPELLATGDLDGNGKDDVVIDFGGIGLWARMNDSAWLKLNNSSPDQIVVGDVDGNGMDDVIADFSSTFGGIFVKRNQGGWSKLHNFTPELMATGDLDGNGKDDVVIDFGGIGLWARMNDAAWLKLHNSSPDLITTGDVDGNGADDVLATFPGQGLWQKLNLGGWSQLNANAPDAVVTGDVDGSGQDDIIARFGSTIGGIFVKRNGGAWAKLHNTSPDSMAVGNLDGL
ncbi:MAG: hypothetical protein BMS9Abin09_1038 [Gammaproteobacteria bacterium]|nr:MAG: hypothetical protein BMS9Abin09_1038 [Gammaproteobacteria bacterium]